MDTIVTLIASADFLCHRLVNRTDNPSVFGLLHWRCSGPDVALALAEIHRAQNLEQAADRSTLKPCDCTGEGIVRLNRLERGRKVS